WVQDLTPPAIADFAVPGLTSFDLDVCPPLGTLPGPHDFTVDLVCDGCVVAQQAVHVTVTSCSFSLSLAVTPDPGCPSVPRQLDASNSAIASCKAPLEYQFKDAAGNVLQAWSPASTAQAPPVAQDTWFTVEVRCSNQANCPGLA